MYEYTYKAPKATAIKLMIEIQQYKSCVEDRHSSRVISEYWLCAIRFTTYLTFIEQFCSRSTNPAVLQNVGYLYRHLLVLMSKTCMCGACSKLVLCLRHKL